MKAEALQAKQAKIFSSYIQSRKILVADTSSASRAGLARTLVGMGAKTQNIILAPSYEIALSELETHKPHVVICDYDLGSQCGLNLLQEQRKNHPDSQQSLFILVTGNTSQSAVAQAAEEDIDMYLLKPYTIDVLRNSIIKAAIAKISPSEYQKVVNEGKTQLVAGKLEEAMATFQKATKLDPKPSLAYFYYGQAHLMKQAMDMAGASYEKGLEFNKIHYKCLVGLYELMMERKMHKEAYDVVKKIARYFPANPERLTSVLRLGIMTQNYEDIERYYQTFTSIDARNEELIRYVCAALIVTGKFYLGQKHVSRALELFQKAGVTAAGKTKVLREIIQTLVQYKMTKEAESFLGRFPPDTHSQADFIAMDYLIADKNGNAAHSVELGRRILQKNEISDPLIYKILIERSVELGYIDSAEKFVQDAVKIYPKEKATFESLLKKDTPSQAEA